VVVTSGIALIGPIGVGKSTVAKLLAERLSRPLCSVDDLRSRYFPEIGYDHDRAEDLLATEGVRAMTEYWKPFEAYEVERIVDDFPDSILDFGAGHSVFDDPDLFGRVQTALAKIPHVILLLPSSDLDSSERTLRERFPPEVADMPGLPELNEYYIDHASNRTLATLVVYTDQKSPQAVVDEILASVRE
jgi:hypothetical protein